MGVVNGWIDKWMDGRMLGWIDRWMEGRMDGWMMCERINGYMDSETYACSLRMERLRDGHANFREGASLGWRMGDGWGNRRIGQWVKYLCRLCWATARADGKHRSHRFIYIAFLSLICLRRSKIHGADQRFFFGVDGCW